MAIVVILVALLLAGVSYQAFGHRRDTHRYRPPGKIVPTASAGLHVLDQGSGDLAVVLEAGVAGTLLGWARVQPAISRFTRVLSYDRAGLGWSGRLKNPPTLDSMLADLDAVIETSGAGRPIILVGHSFGGLLALSYAHTYPDAVAGLVLVDPAGVDTWAQCSAANRNRLNTGVRLSRRGALLARLGVVRMALDLLASGGRKLPKLIGTTAAGRGASTITRLIGEVQLLPADCAPRIRSHWSNPKSFSAMAFYLECLPRIAAAVEQFRLPSKIPITILSAATATEAELREREHWAAGSSRGHHIRVPDSGHWIQIRRPDAVVDAVADMLAATPVGGSPTRVR